MKKYFILFLFPLLLCCHTYNVEIKDNPFQKTTDIEVKMWHKVVEGNLDNLEANYQCSIKDGKRSLTMVKFHFQLGSLHKKAHNPWASFKNVGLDEWAYILVDDKSYKIKITEPKTDRVIKIVGNSKSLWGGTYNEIYGSMMLNDEIERQIVKAEKVMYRFTAGNDPTVLIATDDQLEKMKEYFSIKP